MFISTYKVPSVITLTYNLYLTSFWLYSPYKSPFYTGSMCTLRSHKDVQCYTTCRSNLIKLMFNEFPLPSSHHVFPLWIYFPTWIENNVTYVPPFLSWRIKHLFKHVATGSFKISTWTGFDLKLTVRQVPYEWIMGHS